ncbi:MAG: acetyl-CoA carboxylase biotin carboxylase subunit [Bacillota bacterium]|nr:acetyl-CoA carboxylase biotin carboxylase subunit [Bacillota bacterium]
MFSKILIANRGEIAVRVIRACKEMGILSAAVYSEADADALHVSLADESYCIGPSNVKESYLNQKAIISAALACHAEAIHPGYGLLSENAGFASLCAKYGLHFIGPDAEVISKMGDKNEARKSMVAANVPVIPGSDTISDVKSLREEAEKIGFPLLIKARSGGGGRGIRLVKNASELESAFLVASTEAKNAFGDGGVYLEKYLYPVRHIEIQLLCDNNGNVVTLGERECSVQRKNQKLIEESPSPAVTGEIREKMEEATVRAAKAVSYRGAGTIEFLLDENKNFYFMEMNTRLQVEHPVTEMVTDIDIVKWQIRIASDMPLDFTRTDIKGHAIECRIVAENPKENYKPSCGKVTLLHVPSGPWVRFDSALYQDFVITPFYDSMIGKLIVHAKTREEAIRKMRSSLCELVIEGVEHNREAQLEILSSDEFESGVYFTDTFFKRG